MNTHLPDAALAANDAPHVRSRALGVLGLVIATIIAVTLVIIAVNSQRLVVEQQRTTCYARLSWLAPGEEDRPFGADRSGAARSCEGRSPLIEFQDSP